MIFRKFVGKVAQGSRKKPFHFGGNPNHVKLELGLGWGYGCGLGRSTATLRKGSWRLFSTNILRHKRLRQTYVLYSAILIY